MHTAFARHASAAPSQVTCRLPWCMERPRHKPRGHTRQQASGESGQQWHTHSTRPLRQRYHRHRTDATHSLAATRGDCRFRSRLPHTRALTASSEQLAVAAAAGRQCTFVAARGATASAPTHTAAQNGGGLARAGLARAPRGIHTHTASQLASLTLTLDDRHARRGGWGGWLGGLHASTLHGRRCCQVDTAQRGTSEGAVTRRPGPPAARAWRCCAEDERRGRASC